MVERTSAVHTSDVPEEHPVLIGFGPHWNPTDGAQKDLLKIIGLMKERVLKRSLFFGYCINHRPCNPLTVQ